MDAMARSRIDGAFERALAEGRAAFLPFVEAGDPDLATTEALVLELERAGADAVEIGFPYSDPLADGPVIQRASHRSLVRGTKVDDVLRLAARVRRRSDVAMIAMLSYGLVHRAGDARFLARAKAAGFDAAIVPDLPLDEAGEFLARARDADLPIALLVAPTTPPARARRIAEAARGFLYAVSLTGVTGERASLPKELREHVLALKRETDLPVAVGFGVSRPEHAAWVASFADGVIVGSVLVREVERLAGRPRARIVKSVASLARRLRLAAKRKGASRAALATVR
jgi:tryptophan synthase alpha chain